MISFLSLLRVAEALDDQQPQDLLPQLQITILIFRSPNSLLCGRDPEFCFNYAKSGMDVDGVLLHLCLRDSATGQRCPVLSSVQILYSTVIINS